jgi:hypothetical protein
LTAVEILSTITPYITQNVLPFIAGAMGGASAPMVPPTYTWVKNLILGVKALEQAGANASANTTVTTANTTTKVANT